MLSLCSDLWLLGLFVLGALVGSLINLGVYRLAWHPRPISPWGPRPAAAPPRRWSDRIPVLGWLGLRREAAVHGRGFWIRPLLVELLTGLGFALLYWWEVREQGLLPPVLQGQAWGGVLVTQYAVHLLLITLMLAASLIDADEKIIPDSITVTGTWLGLLVMALFPQAMLPCVTLVRNQAPQLSFLHLGAPNDWPAGLEGAPQLGALAWGLGCWWLWCIALLRRTWYRRHGQCRALQLALARLQRDPSTRPILVMGLIGSGLLAAVWYWGGDHWHGLLTALVGMVVGGLVIWSVRIVGTAALGREAMGFGDVTLMAMIGTFLGWQSCLMVFFLAPFAALLVGVLTLILHQEHEIPYGPFLCMAATFVVVKWAAVWQATQGSFDLILAIGWGMIAGFLLAMIALMALLLSGWRLFLFLIR